MKTKIIFFIVSFYILIAFFWWGYSLINLRTLEVDNEKKNLYEQAENCKHQLIDTLYKQQGSIKSAYIQQKFNQINKNNIFKLTIQNDKLDAETGFDNYIYISPQQSIIQKQDEYLKRKISQYIGEGVFFIILLVWGMILLYRNVQERLNLKQQQNNFILAVTHELKTPVASVKLMLETLQKRTIPDEYREELTHGAIQDIDRLEKLVENVLLTAKIDGFKYDYQKEKIDLQELLEEKVSTFERINSKNQYFRFTCSGEAYIYADLFAINTVFENLISNSVKYAPEDSQIDIELWTKNDEVIVSIKDEAPLIALEERDKIFSKFYRIGNENTRSSKGTGLGLYIVKQIVEQHHAHIYITTDDTQTHNLFVVEFEQYHS